MNFFGKKGTRFDDENDFYDVPVEEEARAEEMPAEESASAPAIAEKSSLSHSPVGLGGGSIELKVVHPEKYEDVVGIAEHLLNHCTVVLNLELANKDVCRRMLDFLSGVAFSIGGQVCRIANNTYIITPSNVDVSDTHMVPTSTEED
jgi:cell division inhibitor SepF